MENLSNPPPSLDSHSLQTRGERIACPTFCRTCYSAIPAIYSAYFPTCYTDMREKHDVTVFVL